MNRIYNEIAQKFDTNPSEVEREIKNALIMARKNPSPTARAFWGEIDENADIEEVIGHIISRIALVV